MVSRGIAKHKTMKPVDEMNMTVEELEAEHRPVNSRLEAES